MNSWIRASVPAQTPAGLKHYGVATIQEGSHQRINLLLLQRFASRHLDEFYRVAGYCRQHFIQRHLATPRVCVLRIAVNAAQRAPGQPDKNTWLSRVRGLALNGEEDFGNAHRNSTGL